ncbi:MAG TPA: 4Fe-4S dicluster domain-containing protein, partial [Vulgatibacter sp.]
AGEPSHGLAPLAASLEREEVNRLVVLDGVDPIYDAPVDLRFAEALPRAREVVVGALHENNTSGFATWFVSGLHFLERWGDARAYDGTLSLIQPLVRPLHGGHSTDEILAAFAGDPAPDDRELLRRLYVKVVDATWESALQHGLFSGAAPEAQVAADPGAVGAAVDAIGKSPALPPLELALRPDPKLGAGEHAANEWLVELPEAITRLGWGNAALMSPATLQAHRLSHGQVIDLATGGASIRIPVLPVEGMADDLISVALGWGNLAHPTKEEYAFRAREVLVGVDAYPLRTSGAPWFTGGVSVAAATRQAFPYAAPESERAILGITQTNLEMHDRPILLGATLEEFKDDPNFVEPHDETKPDLYGVPWKYEGQQWGMAIDLTTCIGCQACVVACVAENNIPTVGRQNLNKGRIMHWLRIDRYRLGGDDDDVRLMPQPMMCQHCEKAPCEYVCPVNATVHSPDGLNEQVYNRCIGTRFCSNNCPYKVRKFNFLLYNDTHMPETLKMSKNPNVTVRGRGVMEKCTYCVQRIRTAEIDARIEQRHIHEGEVRTACQVACPTNAIVFGLLSDPASPVSHLHQLSRTYGVLQHELATEPRTRYLANLRNPNPEMKG